jgi:hypothetical protein
VVACIGPSFLDICTLKYSAFGISGRKQIIVEFKALVSSLPNEMAIVQSELNKYKEAASDLHLLRAEVQSLSSMLKRKVRFLNKLYTAIKFALVVLIYLFYSLHRKMSSKLYVIEFLLLIQK